MRAMDEENYRKVPKLTTREVVHEDLDGTKTGSMDCCA